MQPSILRRWGSVTPSSRWLALPQICLPPCPWKGAGRTWRYPNLPRFEGRRSGEPFWTLKPSFPAIKADISRIINLSSKNQTFHCTPLVGKHSCLEYPPFSIGNTSTQSGSFFQPARKMDPLKPIPKLLPKCLKRGRETWSGHVAVLNEPCNTPTLNLPSDHLMIFISFLYINPVPRTSLLRLLCRSRRIDWSTLVEILGAGRGPQENTLPGIAKVHT